MDLTRGTPAPLLAAIASGHFYPVVLVHLDWPGAPLRAHSGVGVINWSGHAWQGVGRFGGISIPDEALAGVPTEFNLSLITDFPDIEPYTDTPIRGRVGRVSMGATTTPGGNGLIGAVEICAGTADGLALRVEVQQQDGEVVTAFEPKVTMTTGPSMRSMAAVAHSDEDQRRAFPNDTAGRHLVLAEATAQKTLWPAP